MQIHLTATPPTDIRLHARVINQGAAITGLDATFVEGAAASRFTGRAGQVFEGFASLGGSVKRIAPARGKPMPLTAARTSNGPAPR
jgi:leucyl aminopeptidase